MEDLTTNETLQPPKELMKSIENILESVRDLCHSNINALNDPMGKALLETSSHVLEGLMKSFEHYRQGGDVWKSDYTDYDSPQNSSDPWD